MNAKTAWGTELGTESASIDLVLMEAQKPLSAKEILEEVRRRKLPTRQQANPHLSTLKRRGYVTNSGGKWQKTELGGAGAKGKASEPTQPREDAPQPSADESYIEGKERLRLHRSLERSKKLVKRKKQQVLQSSGKLACEVCDFDFAAVYGLIGEGFAECHHTELLSSTRQERKTKLSDLAVVCANCHRILHRKPNCTVPELRELVRKRR